MGNKTKLLLKMGFQTFKKNIIQFLALILIGIISVTIFIGLVSNALTIQAKVANAYENSNFADILVTTNPKNKKDLDDDKKITEILSNKGTYEKRFYSYASLNSFNALFAVSETYPTINKEFNLIKKSEKQTNDNFFVIDRNISYKYSINKMQDGQDLDVGDIATVTLDLSLFDLDDSMINILDNFLNEGKTNPFKDGKINLNFEITGIMECADNVVHTTISPYVFFCSNSKFKEAIVGILKDRFNDLGASLIYNLGFYEILGWGDGNIDSDAKDFPYANQYLIKLNDESQTNDIKNSIKKYFEAKSLNNLYSIQTKEETTNYKTISTDARQAMLMSYIFPFVFFMVTVLIIIASLRQVSTKDRMQIGTLKGIGFKNKEIYAYYLGLFGFIVLLAGIIGSIIGPLIIPNILNVKYKALYTLPQNIFIYPWVYTILTILIFILITNLLVFIVIRRIAILHPSVAMRPKTNKAKHRKDKTVKNFKKRSAFSLSLKISIKDITKDIVKSLMVILGVLGCAMLLVCGFGIEDMGGYGVEHDSFLNSGSDYNLTYLDEIEQSKTDNDLKIIKDDKNITLAYQPYSILTTQIYFNDTSYETNLNIIGPQINFTDNELKSHYPNELPLDKAVISQKLVEVLGIKENDEIYFTYQGEKIKAIVSNIVYEFYTNGIYLPYKTTLIKKDITKFKNAWVDVDEKINQDIVLNSLKNISYVSGVVTLSQAKDLAKTVTSLLTSMTNAIKVFAILLAIVVMFNISLMNYNEKIREVATLKVLGFKRSEISFSLISTIILTSLIGSIIGLLLGKPFMNLVLYINRVQAVCFNDYISISSYVISFLITFGVSFIVNILLALGTNKIKMVESLKSVE